MSSRVIHRCRQSGVSLIELMIGLTLGLLILSGVLYLFAGNKQSYRHQESLSRVQESGRYALELLTRDIRMAGYIGCGNIAVVSVDTNIANSPPTFTNDTAITGTNTTLTVMGGGATMVRLEEVVGPDTLRLDFNPEFQPDQRLMITDCAYADIFEIDSVADYVLSGNTIVNGEVETKNDLTREYQKNAQVMRYQAVTYTYDAVAQSLLRNNQEVIEGVLGMFFEYGIGVGQNITSYAASAAPAADVRAVRVNMVIASPDDPNVSQQFSTTIGLRNRLP